ncbi:MAG: ferrous iron transport protein B [Methylophilaceae bacterium]
MKKTVLIGMPNTGKSTFFNRLSGSSVRVGNWPGITVDLYSVKTLINGNLTELIDLPGIYDLNGYSEDEKIVKNFINNNKIDQIFFILNSTQIDRQLELAIKIQKLGIPILILVNMIDEAKSLGISYNFAEMEKMLNCPVLPISAKYGQGMEHLNQKLNQTQAMPKKNIDGLNDQDIAQKIYHKTVEMPAILNDQKTQILDNIFLHPWLGIPLFLLIILTLFQIIFTLGAPIQESMGNLFSYLQINYLENIFFNSPPILKSFLLDGLYSGITTVAAFVPIIIIFFFVMTVVEDSGYFSRAAFLMDKMMEKIGLDGRGFVMMLMGYGCNVPALMGTKIMRSKNLRFLTMLVIPFSLCSARLQVFLFIIFAFFSGLYGALILFCLYLLSFCSIFITAIIFKQQYSDIEPLVLELPPYRFPTLKQMVIRGWQEVKHFLNRATKFIVIGVVAVWVLTYFPSEYPIASQQTYAGQIGLFFEPIFKPIGIDQMLVIALIFGFIAKEILIGALAIIFGLEGQALASYLSEIFTNGQAISFMIFTLIYTPCVSTIATLHNESKDIKLTIYSITWSLLLAWIASFIFYQSYQYFFYN